LLERLAAEQPATGTNVVLVTSDSTVGLGLRGIEGGKAVLPRPFFGTSKRAEHRDEPSGGARGQARPGPTRDLPGKCWRKRRVRRVPLQKGGLRSLRVLAKFPPQPQGETSGGAGTEVLISKNHPKYRGFRLVRPHPHTLRNLLRRFSTRTRGSAARPLKAPQRLERGDGPADAPLHVLRPGWKASSYFLAGRRNSEDLIQEGARRPSTRRWRDFRPRQGDVVSARSQVAVRGRARSSRAIKTSPTRFQATPPLNQLRPRSATRPAVAREGGRTAPLRRPPLPGPGGQRPVGEG